MTLRNDIYRLIKRCFGFNAATVSTLRTDPLGSHGIFFFCLRQKRSQSESVTQRVLKWCQILFCATTSSNRPKYINSLAGKVIQITRTTIVLQLFDFTLGSITIIVIVQMYVLTGIVPAVGLYYNTVPEMRGREEDHEG